jgi:hemolysin D
MNLANKQIIPFPGPRDRRDRDELAFLPAALEIVETPPSPLGRATGLIIVVLFGAALAWACIGTVDIIASSHGKIIPSGKTKVIQPFETSVVRAIHVHDGQMVKAGDVLIELDSTMNKAEGGQLRNDLIAAQLDIARLKAALAAAADAVPDGVDPLTYFHPTAAASPDAVATQKRFLLDQVSEHRAEIAALERQEAEKEAERATAAATIEKIEALIPLLQQRVDIRETLYNHQTGSKWNYLEILQAATEQKQELKVQRKKLEQAVASMATIVAKLAQTRAEFGRKLSGELAEAQRKAGGFAQGLIKAEEKVRLQVMTASVDGVVQQLSVHTVGGVVTPAQTLLVLVPQENHLEIEATVSNRDIGFIHAGQPAEVKVDTFPFTRYGLLHGKVLSVSQDAITHDKQPNGAAKATANDEPTSEPKGQDLDYAARVSLDRTQMQVDDRVVDLSPGMAVTVEIRTGTRRIISYLVSPLLRYKQESLRER